ncbi:hypothetical protein PCANC_20271 [Puccinia coronata f. sp. avenae]|uniref:Uncharacterized protein n=1 Tax=Puccinia coronata f. sp. avenae TaxID=200324 RepID=A0A2N5SL40_9BASI|nr:hypothetical protein PCANC_20271 [Puccinia coronata f. sp. avenae]
MMAKLKEYFHTAIKKPVYLCLTLLDPRLKTSQLTSDVLALVGLTLNEVLARFTDEASKFFVTDTCEASEQHEEIQSKTRSSRVIYKQKKRKIASLDEEIEAYLSGKCEIESCNTLLYTAGACRRHNSAVSFVKLTGSTSATVQRQTEVPRHIVNLPSRLDENLTMINWHANVKIPKGSQGPRVDICQHTGRSVKSEA